MHGCEIRIYPAFADGQTIPGIGVFKVLGTSVSIRIGQISDDSPAVAVEPVQTIEELPELFRAVAAAMHLVNAWERQRGNEPPFDLHHAPPDHRHALQVRCDARRKGSPLPHLPARAFRLRPAPRHLSGTRKGHRRLHRAPHEASQRLSGRSAQSASGTLQPLR